MDSRIATVARYTTLEALRTRLPALAAIVIGVLLGASFFVREITIAESARFQTAFYASTVRFAMVLLSSLYVVGSIAREFQDKVLDVTLALDLPRSHYVIGKVIGFVAIAGVLALAVGAPLVPLAGWESAAQWTLSLAFELAIVVALSVFCVVTFNQVMPAAGIVIAFYFFARALTAIRLIGAHPIAGADTLSHQFMYWLVEALALLIPALDQWTRTAWLVDGPVAWFSVIAIGAQSVLFVVILTTAAIFDMHRRNF
jgi:hypothetical protein